MSKDNMRSLGTAVKDDCEPQCGHLESNSGPLQEQQLLSTTEPPSSPKRTKFYLGYKKNKTS